MFKLELVQLLVLYGMLQSLSCQQNSDDGVEYFKVLRHAQNRNDQMQKYTFDGNTSPLKNPFSKSRQDEIIARVEDLMTSGFDAVSTDDVSVHCLNHTKLLIEAILSRETWAFRSEYMYISVVCFVFSSSIV